MFQFQDENYRGVPTVIIISYANASLGRKARRAAAAPKRCRTSERGNVSISSRLGSSEADADRLQAAVGSHSKSLQGHGRRRGGAELGSGGGDCSCR